MAPVGFEYKSARAGKARMGRWFDGPVYPLLRMTGYVMLLAGAVLLIYAAAPLGWLVMGCSVLPLMFAWWYKGDIMPLPPDQHARGVDGRLARDVLAHLPPNPTPAQIVVQTAHSQGGRFMAVRTGIGKEILLKVVEMPNITTPAIWQEAVRVAQETGSTTIHGGVLVAACMRLYPQYDVALARMKLTPDELMGAVRWYNHIQDLVVAESRPRRTGGIARDWAFGYVPLLRRFGISLSELGSAIITETESQARALSHMVEVLGSNGRQNVTLVGPAGVGKTTVVRAFAQRLMDAESDVPRSLSFRQVFLLDASSLISAAPDRGAIEGLVMRVLAEAYRAQNIIICLDNAQLFFEDGTGSVDLTNVLLPILEAGRVRMILTMDEQRLLQISQRNPSLVNALNRVTIAPASQSETIAVLQDKLITIEHQKNVAYMYQALGQAYRLSERYVYDLAMPGRALKLLDSAAHYAEGGLVMARSVDQAIEQTMDVKVSVASTDDERAMLLQLEDRIHKRMINQSRAVKVVSDALRRARAGVRNQDRPIGTFLFLGPTGVGKTELAKALADVYFGGEGRLIRLDLNEYVSADDVSRLIADGAQDSHSLTAQVMKQPFSVVLLDEIEKAHPNVLNTLLQLLDEGILRDIKNREVSFRDAIVIATSNAGADRIRQYVEAGHKLEQFEDQFVDELINSNQFKPEFLNRFDEIVVFKPLEKPELLQVIDLMIAGVNKTLAMQKIRVRVTDDAKILLVEHGYDPRLGARPMRRVVQRAVENTVAKQMLAGTAQPGAEIIITRDQVAEALGFAP